MTLPPPFPLAWPERQARTRNKQPSPFRTKLEVAIKNVQTSLRLFAQDSGKAMGPVVVTMNATMFDQKPADSGVAIWFDWDGQTRCIAVDRFGTVADNLQAVHHVIEARRTELRYAGIEMARTAFAGFIALPAPDQAEAWHNVLGVPATAGVDEISAARKKLARQHAGDDRRMAAINVAHDQGMQLAGGRP